MEKGNLPRKQNFIFPAGAAGRISRVNLINLDKRGRVLSHLVKTRTVLSDGVQEISVSLQQIKLQLLPTSNFNQQMLGSLITT